MTQDHHRFYGATLPPHSAEVDVRIGVSYVTSLAPGQSQAEMPDNNFERLPQQTVQDWNKELGAIEVEAARLTITGFSTRPSTTASSPADFDDVDGRYRGFDDQIHQVPKATNISTPPFGLGHLPDRDTPSCPYRPECAGHGPVLVEEYNKRLYRSLVAAQPATDHERGSEHDCSGHVWNAGLHNFDVNTAYEGMFKQTLAGNIHGYLPDWSFTMRKGRHHNQSRCSVATALEHELSFAPWYLAKLYKTEDATYLFGRPPIPGDVLIRSPFFAAAHRDGRWTPASRLYGRRQMDYLWFVPHDVQVWSISSVALPFSTAPR